MGENFAPISALNPLNPSYQGTLEPDFFLQLFVLNNPPAAPTLLPELAQGYSVNPNYTQFTITLLPNLKWDNGSPLNATDMWYTLWLYNITDGWGISSFTITNSTSVEVDFSQSNYNFITTDLASDGTPVLPYSVYGSIPVSGEDLSNVTSFEGLTNIVADGPWIVQNISPGENPIVLTANPYYFQPGYPKIHTFYWYTYSSLSSYVAAYKAGTLDAFYSTGPYASVLAVASFSGHTLVGPPAASPSVTEGINFNVWTYPFNESTFRQALAYGTNISALDQTMNGPYANASIATEDALAPQYNVQLGFSGAGPQGYSFNVSRARQLFIRAGFKYSGSTLEYPNGTAMSISIRFDSTNGYDESVTTLLAGQWSNLGISVSPLPTTDLQAYTSGDQGFQVWVGYGFYGFTDGPGISVQLNNYDATTTNGTILEWNNTFYQYISNASQYAPNSTQATHYDKLAAESIAYEVPYVPIYVEPNWESLSNSFYWGNPSQFSGAFNYQSNTQSLYFFQGLALVAPINTTSTTSSSTSVTSSSSATPSSSSSSTSSSAVSLTTSIPTTSSTSVVTTIPPSSSPIAYVAIAVIVVVLLIIAAAVAMMRRRKPPATTASPAAPSAP